MAFAIQIFAVSLLAVLPFAVLEVDASSYASLNSGDGKFELKWTYNNTANKLMFKMKCKGMGWCAVGFSTDPGDGSGMKNYDIAVGGVDAGTKYLADYMSTSKTNPTKDGAQNLDLIDASEAGEYTNVDFSRDAMTGDTPNDVQFKNDTEVYVMWAYNSNTDANTTLGNLNGQHTMDTRGRITTSRHNLIMMAMSAAMQPSTTPTGSTGSTGSTPTTSTAASEAGSRFVAYAIILALSVCILSF